MPEVPVIDLADGGSEDGADSENDGEGEVSMTTRRQFFGLLAAAPIAVPAVAEAALNAATSGPRARTFTSEWAGGTYTLYGETVPLKVFPRFNNTVNFRSEPCRLYEFHPFEAGNNGDYSTAYIPNRLYGTQINEEGEAI